MTVTWLLNDNTHPIVSFPEVIAIKVRSRRVRPKPARRDVLAGDSFHGRKISTGVVTRTRATCYNRPQRHAYDDDDEQNDDNTISEQSSPSGTKYLFYQSISMNMCVVDKRINWPESASAHHGPTPICACSLLYHGRVSCVTARFNGSDYYVGQRGVQFVDGRSILLMTGFY